MSSSDRQTQQSEILFSMFRFLIIWCKLAAIKIFFTFKPKKILDWWNTLDKDYFFTFKPLEQQLQPLELQLTPSASSQVNASGVKKYFLLSTSLHQTPRSFQDTTTTVKKSLVALLNIMTIKRLEILSCLRKWHGYYRNK